MSVTESFERFLALEEQSLDRLESILEAIRADIEWLEALDASERAQQGVCDET